MFGLLNINKPSAMTSREVVDHVQRLLPSTKAGHAGTLDPLACGVLVVALGPATRLVPYVQRMAKHYRATFLLGRASDTEDVEGQVVHVDCPRPPSGEQLESVIGRFVGQITQRPPSYSALKVRGRRAYNLARAGRPVPLAPRRVTIYHLRLLSYDYPQLQLEVVCGGGTYIRSLGRDIAAEFGTASVMSALVRTAIGTFSLGDACHLQTLADDGIAPHLLPPSRATALLPQATLTDPELDRVARGIAIENRWGVSGKEIAALDAAGHLVALLRPRPHGRLGPMRNFAASERGDRNRGR
jgi:tRNA pseudouridine55 synthase